MHKRLGVQSRLVPSGKSVARDIAFRIPMCVATMAHMVQVHRAERIVVVWRVVPMHNVRAMSQQLTSVSNRMHTLKNFSSSIPFALFLSAFGCFLFVLAQWGFQITSGWRTAVISCDAVHDWGEVAFDEVVPEHHFIVKNIGKRELKLESVATGCGACLKVVHYTKAPIPPGEYGVVVVQLLPEKLEGAFERGVVVHSNDPKQPVYLLQLRAYITRGNTESGGI